MTYLLDTNVVSQWKRARTDPAVTEWFTTTRADRLYVSVLTIGEMERGVTMLLERGDARQAAIRRAWLDDIVDAYRGRVALVSLATATEWGRQPRRRSTPLIDGLIAATAKVNGWTLVTRNVKDFAGLGVRVFDPWTGSIHQDG